MLRLMLLAAALHGVVYAQPVLYATASFTKDYFIGAKLPPSGLFVRQPDGTWRQSGYQHPFLFGMEVDPQQPGAVLLAGGNGLIRAAVETGQWTILTGSDVTELRDVAVDPRRPGTVYFAYVHGLRVTRDGGRTWQELAAGLRRRAIEQVALDVPSGALLIGTENGVYRSTDEGRTWRLAGADGFMVQRLRQSPHDPCYWLAATQQGGLFGSADCGQSFENVGRLGAGSNLYDVAFDPQDAQTVVVGGWDVGVAISKDRGRTWTQRNQGLPATHVTSLAFHPEHRQLYAAVHNEAIFVSEDGGLTWRSAGLQGGHINRLRFLTAVRP